MDRSDPQNDPSFSEPIKDSLLRIGAAIAHAHSDTFQAMMLDLIQRNPDLDPTPKRDAILAALRPGDPTGPGQHILDAVRITLAAHELAGDELIAMSNDRSPLALIAGMAGMDPVETAAASYAFVALQSATDATVAAIILIPAVATIAAHATQSPQGATEVAVRANLALRMFAALCDDTGYVPKELIAAARTRITAKAADTRET